MEIQIVISLLPASYHLYALLEAIVSVLHMLHFDKYLPQHRVLLHEILIYSCKNTTRMTRQLCSCIFSRIMVQNDPLLWEMHWH